MKSLPTRILVTSGTHFVMPTSRHLKLPKPSTTNVYEEERIRIKEMTEESITERFNDSLLEYYPKKSYI